MAFAEEYGHLLDENMGSKFDDIGVNAMAHKVMQVTNHSDERLTVNTCCTRNMKSIIKKK